jgi:hypothetical protein
MFNTSIDYANELVELTQSTITEVGALKDYVRRFSMKIFREMMSRSESDVQKLTQFDEDHFLYWSEEVIAINEQMRRLSRLLKANMENMLELFETKLETK